MVSSPFVGDLGSSLPPFGGGWFDCHVSVLCFGQGLRQARALTGLGCTAWCMIREKLVSGCQNSKPTLGNK